jgi:dolichyl-phosphate-mannose-protein mannosyltransferase
MASEKGATSGLDFETQSTRRRNVPSNPPNGGVVNKVEIDKKKTQVKKVSNDDPQIVVCMDQIAKASS